MLNAQIRQFRDSMLAMTNACMLPIEVKRLVLAEVYTAISDQSDTVIEAEKIQSLKKEEEKKDE